MPPLILTAAVLLLIGGFAYLAYRGRNRRGEPGTGDNSGSGSEGYASWNASDSGPGDTFTAGGGDFGGGGASGGWDDGGSESGGGDSGGGDSGGGDGGGGGSD